jgi:hypothetical protein
MDRRVYWGIGGRVNPFKRGYDVTAKGGVIYNLHLIPRFPSSKWPKPSFGWLTEPAVLYYRRCPNDEVPRTPLDREAHG